ncbi:MAG: serine/threonine-protein kinase [Verrucomicrobiia bacterium]
MSETIKSDHCPRCGAAIPPEALGGLCPKCVMLGAAEATEPEGPDPAAEGAPSIERVAAAFPQLEILELIGRGGMGFVFKARQPHLDRFVALKLLPDKLAKDPRFAERFNREGRFLAKLSHPNIVTVYDFGVTGPFYYLIMEFVDGVNLRDAMQAGRFSPEEALSIVPRICEALQYAHQQGVLHRDIKPANILLDTRGQVKLADFGIAKLVGDDKPDVTLTGTGAALGTPHYMAPEQLEKPSAVDHRADIYSLGVVFYEMLTGELPIGRFAPPSSKTPVGADVDQVVFRTLEKDRERRYQSAGELKTQVEHLTRTEAPGGHAAPPVVPSPGADEAPQWSQKAIWGAVLTALSLPLPLLLFGVVLYKGGGIGIWEMLICLVANLAFGLPGTILGWMALSDIRAQRGRLRGLPFAVFSAMTWPLLILFAVTLIPPWLVIVSRPEASISPLPVLLVSLLVAAGALTFAIWSIYAVARWASEPMANSRRSVLKWALLALLVAGFALALQATMRRNPRGVVANTVPQPVIGYELHPNAVDPMIQFTFTSVDLREEDDAQWLTMDYVQQVHGQCEAAFPWVSTIPGWTCEVRNTAFVAESDDRFPPVQGQRVAWKLPDTLDPVSAKAFRDSLVRLYMRRPVALQIGSEQTLFEVGAPGGGSLTAKVAVKPPIQLD